ncbi:hypothetical protein ACFX1T_010045 [Malus domestica]
MSGKGAQDREYIVEHLLTFVQRPTPHVPSGVGSHEKPHGVVTSNLGDPFGNGSREKGVPCEIVQIPLDENEVGNLEVSLENDKNAGVQLIEDPPIGAPFWLMSYVARYVCSADLVWLLVFYLAIVRVYN